MAKIHCAISGLAFHCDHMPIVLPSSVGYYHPIFVLPYKKLYGLYSKHCSGHLTPTDSYLLFLAFLHSTDQIEWEVPCALNPSSASTMQLIESNLKELIEVIELTNVIITPSFKQPSFRVSVDNNSLTQIPSWILAWNKNIGAFRNNYRNQRIKEDLQKVENKLSYYIKSGLHKKEYSSYVAAWADKAAAFPVNKRDAFTKIIRSCFNSEKMFSIPLSEIKEVKSYCEENIEAGSIHFHTLMEVLVEGISRHTDFLGMNPIALGYTLMPIDSSKNDAKVAAILTDAPTEAPKREDYDSPLSYLRASLKYRTASIHKKALKESETTEKGE